MTSMPGAAFDPSTQGLAGTDSQRYQEYLSQLKSVLSGVVGRIVIPDINVNMPI
jgi:sortase A